MVGRSLIIFPAAPPSLPDITLDQVAGGSIANTTYSAFATWVIQTQDGTQWESLPGPEEVFEVSADFLLKVSLNSVPQMPYALIGWNLYITAGSIGTETQQAFGLDLDADWTEPDTGLIAGTDPPTKWGYELIFKYPGRQFPYFNPKRVGHDDLSTAGWQQSITWYVDELTTFEVPYISSDDDAWAWKQFLGSAVRRVPFDFYQDSTLESYVTLLLNDDNPAMSYRAPGLYQTKMTCRKVILTQ
jgi:hypothetical protein